MKNFMKHVPGFRTDRIWKKVLAGIGYSFLLFVLLPIVLQGSFVDSLWNLINVIATIAFVCAVVALIKGSVRALRITNRKIAFLVLLVSIIVAGAVPFPAGSEQAIFDIQEEAQQDANVHEQAAQKIATNSENGKATQEEVSKPVKDEVQKSDEEDKHESEATTEQRNNADNQAAAQMEEDHGPDAQVTRVVDGDTVKINLNGREETVRLLLVDTPETKHPSKPVQPFGPEASSFAKKHLSGKQVEVEYDGPKRDKYDRLLAYIWVDGKMFNQMLLEEGLTRLAYVYDPPYTHYKEYMKAQNLAKAAEKGIWSRDGYVRDDGFYYGNGSDTSSSGSNEGAVGDNGSDASDNMDKDSTTSASVNLKYDPNGPDRDCGDFDKQQEAQTFYEAAGGPVSDPHRLDGHDEDGFVCESLP